MKLIRDLKNIIEHLTSAYRDDNLDLFEKLLKQAEYGHKAQMLDYLYYQRADIKYVTLLCKYNAIPLKINICLKFIENALSQYGIDDTLFFR